MKNKRSNSFFYCFFYLFLSSPYNLLYISLYIYILYIFFRHNSCKRGLYIYIFIYYITRSFLHVHTHCLYDKTCKSKATTNSKTVRNLIHSAPLFRRYSVVYISPTYTQTDPSYIESNA